MFVKIGVLGNVHIFNILMKTVVLESLFDEVAGLQAFNFIKKETPTQVLSCEFWEILENTFFPKTPCCCFWIDVHYIRRLTEYSFLAILIKSINLFSAGAAIISDIFYIKSSLLISSLILPALSFSYHTVHEWKNTEAVVRRCSVKKVYLEISQNSPQACNFIKKKLDWRYTNADLKISLYVLIHKKITAWKLFILNLKILELFTRKLCIFLKN